MKAQVLAIAVVIATFSGISRADSACAAGSFASLIGTSCTIGDKLFTFTGEFTEDGTGAQIANPSLVFTPSATPTSSEFTVTGFPGTSGDNVEGFFGYFSAVPLSGTIISTTATINGISQDSTSSSQVSNAELDNNILGLNAFDQYASNFGSTTHTNIVGSPAPSFTGDFFLENSSFSPANSHGVVISGSTGFDSATFVLNESNTTTVPEGSELAMLGITVAGIFCALKRKSVASLAS